MNESKKLHPIGLLPRYIYESKVNESRINDIQDAIKRYLDAKLEVDVEWVKEYNCLLSRRVEAE